MHQLIVSYFDKVHHLENTTVLTLNSEEKDGMRILELRHEWSIQDYSRHYISNGGP